MIATKTKKPPVVGDHLPITPFQIKEIMKNCAFEVDTKSEWVQWATEDVNRTSLKSITQGQAIKILKQQTGVETLHCNVSTGGNWGYFDSKNNQHRYITVLLRNANIVVKSNKWGEVADMEGWFSTFLKSNRSPVKKPLKEMTVREVSRIITALEGVAIWKNSI